MKTKEIPGTKGFSVSNPEPSFSASCRNDLDALNGLIILDDEMYQKLRRLEPHTGVLDLEKPRTVSSNLKLPAPVLGTIGNWLHREQ